MTPEEYIQLRVDDQINWYSKKSGINKKYHYLTNVWVIIFSAIIPFATGINDQTDNLMSYFIGLLGILIVILTGFSTLYKFQDKWSNYRKTAELLTHEKFLFQTNSGAYASHKNPFKLFVYRVENIINEEVSNWNKYINEEETE